MKTAYCRSCGAQIYFIRTPAGKLTPVDAEQRLYRRNISGRDRVITWEGDVISCDLDVEPADADGIGYISHFATCPAAAAYRRRG